MPTEFILKEVPITFITPTIVWAQGKQQGRSTAPPINRKFDSRFREHDATYQDKIQFPT